MIFFSLPREMENFWASFWPGDFSSVSSRKIFIKNWNIKTLCVRCKSCLLMFVLLALDFELHKRIISRLLISFNFWPNDADSPRRLPIDAPGDFSLPIGERTNRLSNNVFLPIYVTLLESFTRLRPRPRRKSTLADYLQK